MVNHPEYLVVRIDSAIEESSFAYTGGIIQKQDLVIDPSIF